MLYRVENWFTFLNIPKAEADRADALCRETLGPSAGMMSIQDLHALAAALLHHKPAKIFEIGTYMGASSNFFLSLLPKARVVSVAYVGDGAPASYNNDELRPDQVGSLVTPENRSRYVQILGDSHKILAKEFIARFGKMDFVFIDGDHSRQGVAQDTELARKLIVPSGAIGWHDANPKRKYIGSRLFLEQDLPQTALATADNYIGGVAFWTAQLEKRLIAGQDPAPSSTAAVA